MTTILNFTNAIASTKDDSIQIDEATLRTTKIYAKLMLAKGEKFEAVTSREQFLLSESGDYIRAELFFINKNNNMLIDHRLYLNVAIDAVIKANTQNKFYYAELIHPTISLAEDEATSF